MNHYYDNNENLKSELKEKTFSILDREYKVKTDNGVFAKNGLDFATKLLLENIILLDCGSVLDLGCGYGVIGLCVKTINPKLVVDMVDVNDRALNLSKMNTKHLEVSVFKSNCYEKIDKKYDMIITNPPIRAGKVVVHDMLLNAYKHLNKNGELWFVMNKKHGLNSALKLLEDIFGDTETIEKKKGFSIIKCTNSDIKIMEEKLCLKQ